MDGGRQHSAVPIVEKEAHHAEHTKNFIFHTFVDGGPSNIMFSSFFMMVVHQLTKVHIFGAR